MGGERLAAYLIGLGLAADNVVAIQLPNWSEFPVAISAAMLAGIPFCQFHADFRAREVEFVLVRRGRRRRPRDASHQILIG
jgi:acyl-CoA synthetase (AMP-forming)/AMP-acid ligase II